RGDEQHTRRRPEPLPAIDALCPVSAQLLARHAGGPCGHLLWRIFCQYLLVILILSFKGRAGLANHELPEPSVGVNWVRVTGSGDLRDTSLATLAVLTEEMRWRLYSFVRAAHRPVSREEAAASTGITRNPAAFHLDQLVAPGPLRARSDAPLGPHRARPHTQ